MSRRTVWLSEEAYQSLTEEQRPDERMSEVVMRLSETDSEDERTRLRA